MARSGPSGNASPVSIKMSGLARAVKLEISKVPFSFLGHPDHSVGREDGRGVGRMVGSDDGAGVGKGVGSGEGRSVGAGTGTAVGDGIGRLVGAGTGASVGAGTGSCVGAGTGPFVGAGGVHLTRETKRKKVTTATLLL